MDISVTQFRSRCLELIRAVETTRATVVIRRRGRIVARLESAQGDQGKLRPWEQLRALGGAIKARPDERVLDEKAFEAGQ